MNYARQPWPPVATKEPELHADAPEPGSKLGVHYPECFGCGDEVEHGLHIQSTVGEGVRVHSRFMVGRQHQGAPGLAHGGLLACAFDEALGRAVGYLLRIPAVTGRLETDFRRPVPVGSTLHITAQLDGIAQRKIYVSADGRLDAEDGPSAVRARGLFVVVGFDHFTTHGDSDSIAKLGAVETQGADKNWDINP